MSGLQPLDAARQPHGDLLVGDCDQDPDALEARHLRHRGREPSAVGERRHGEDRGRPTVQDDPVADARRREEVAPASDAHRHLFYSTTSTCSAESRSASVSSATSASSCTSADDDSSSSDPSSARAARPGLAVDELGDPGVDGLRGDDAPGGDGLGLADAVAAVDGLGLLGVGPGQLGEHDVRGDLQVDARRRPPSASRRRRRRRGR